MMVEWVIIFKLELTYELWSVIQMLQRKLHATRMWRFRKEISDLLVGADCSIANDYVEPDLESMNIDFL